ncbi:MAG: MFS transporter [Variibacter sp.]|nr:MFS transporter [Variibacter sp.]
MDAPRFWIACALLWLCGAALRITILAVPPVITAIQADLSLSGTEVGLLSGLPVVLFALFAVPGSLLIVRLGVAATLVIGLVLTAVGASLRGALLSVVVLYAATIVMGAGIAMMQVALPAAVRQWTPHRIGFATALYTNGLLVGEILPVALTTPYVLPLVDGSWRLSLAVWAAPLLPFALLVLAFAPRQKAEGAGAPGRRWWPDWSSPLLWRLGLVFASTTAIYFGANAFLPARLAEAGRADLIAPALTALNSGQLPASFALLAVAGRLAGRPWPLVAIGVLALGCVVGMAASASYWTVACAGLLGFVLAAALTLGLTLPAVLCAPEDMARMTAGVFTVSYLLSVATSVVGGAAWDVTDRAGAAFVVLAAAALPLIVVPPTMDFRRAARSDA